MSASSGQIREALAASLRVIPSLTPYAFAPSKPHPPCAFVTRGQVQYDEAMGGGTHLWTMVVRAFVAHTSDIGSQQLLDQYLSADGDLSIKAAIEADTTLGGVVADLHVTQASGEQEYVRDQGGPLLGSEWTVEVWL